MTTHSTFKILTLAAMSLVLLSGCETGKGAPWASSGTKSNDQAKAKFCPQMIVSPELGRVNQLRNSEVVSETIIANSRPTQCTPGDGNVTLRLAIDFKGKLGPVGLKDAANESNYSIPYLIAVIDPQGQIISKDIFAITMTYKKGQTEQSYSDLLEQVIPMAKGSKPGDYKIMLGFQLTPEELAYNRVMAAQNPSK